MPPSSQARSRPSAFPISSPDAPPLGVEAGGQMKSIALGRTLKALGRAARSPGMTVMGALSPKFSEMMRGASEPEPAVYEESTAYEGGGEEELEKALALLVAAM